MIQNFDISTFVNVTTEENILKGIVDRVKLRRKELKLTQKEFAKRSGVSYGFIRRFENSGEISLTSLLKIANAINCLEDFKELFKYQQITSLKDYK